MGQEKSNGYSRGSTADDDRPYCSERVGEFLTRDGSSNAFYEMPGTCLRTW